MEGGDLSQQSLFLRHLITPNEIGDFFELIIYIQNVSQDELRY